MLTRSGGRAARKNIAVRRQTCSTVCETVGDQSHERQSALGVNQAIQASGRLGARPPCPPRSCFPQGPPPTSHAVSHRYPFYRTMLRRALGALVCLAPILPAGCDVRDEEAQAAAVSPWPPQVVDRLTPPSQRSPHSSSASHALDFIDGYAAGSRRATELGVPMLLVFRASWCRWSEPFVAEVLTTPQLVERTGRFICVAIDADRDPATCRSFGVQAFPTAIILDRERRETFRASGAAARDGLALAVQSVLEDPDRRVAGRSATTPR